MSTLAELHERWSRDPDYREAYEQLGPEYEAASNPCAENRSRLLRQERAREFRVNRAKGGRMLSAFDAMNDDAIGGLARNTRWRR